jgi:hypothetical protein
MGHRKSVGRNHGDISESGAAYFSISGNYPSVLLDLTVLSNSDEHVTRCGCCREVIVEDCTRPASIAPTRCIGGGLCGPSRLRATTRCRISHWLAAALHPYLTAPRLLCISGSRRHITPEYSSACEACLHGSFSQAACLKFPRMNLVMQS